MTYQILFRSLSCNDLEYNWVCFDSPIPVYLLPLPNLYFMYQNISTESDVSADLPFLFPYDTYCREKLFNKQLFDSNIRFIYHIIEEDGTFLKHASFCNIYRHVMIHFSEHASIIHTFVTFIKSSNGNKKNLEKVACPFIRSNIYSVQRILKKSIFFYEILNKNPSVTTGRKKVLNFQR